MSSQVYLVGGARPIVPILAQTMGDCAIHLFTNFICMEINGKWNKVCEKCLAENGLEEEE